MAISELNRHVNVMANAVTIYTLSYFPTYITDLSDKTASITIANMF